MAGSFIDTNVLVYLASADPDKAARAEEIVARGGTINVQVLNELANVARRKMLLSWDETHELLATLRRLVVGRETAPLSTSAIGRRAPVRMCSR